MGYFNYPGALSISLKGPYRRADVGLYLGPGTARIYLTYENNLVLPS